MAFYMHYLRNTNIQDSLAGTSANNTISYLDLATRHTQYMDSKNEEDMRSTNRSVNSS
ncbi:MAG: hypothetical protein NPIRA04_28090 [Nitrospirales bacterium]|nr:MAG: hypothetical protein NPIRA04_28090 [Nitrospirales bacterium]